MLLLMVAVKEVLISFWEYFLSVVIPRFFEMVVVPMQKRDALELLVPLVIALFLVQIYFGRNKEESIGWNTAFGNCIVLLFVISKLINYVYEKFGFIGFHTVGGESFYKTILIICLCLLTLALMLIDFFHAIDRRISFFLSSSIFITVIAFISVVLVYSDIPFDNDTLITSLLFLFAVIIFFEIFRYIIPASERAEKYLEREKRIKKVIRKRKIMKIKKRVLEFEEEKDSVLGNFGRNVKRFFKK